MKIKLLLIALIFTAFACKNATKETTEEVVEQQILANVQKIEIGIEGMTCTGCENTIQNTIKEFEGVYSVTASFENGTAIIEVDSTKADIVKIEEAINGVGYNATGHKKILE